MVRIPATAAARNARPPIANDLRLVMSLLR
jgi:hypothetical protein